MPDIRNTLLLLIPMLMAITFHEFAHALMAKRLGDNTAERAGRLSLNPIVHLDLIGTMMILFSGLFGWAKPVPINSNNFKNPIKGQALVALAGPLANIILAAISFFLLLLFIYFNIANLSQNLTSYNQVIFLNILGKSIIINIGFAIFNLLPFYPLDGFSIASYIFPSSITKILYEYKWLFFVILIAGIYFNIFGYILAHVIQAINNLLAYLLFILH